MSAPAGLLESVGRALGSAVDRAERVSGGDINEAWRLELADHRRVFLKSRASADPSDFQAEAAGLRWLAEHGAIGVPNVLGVGEDVPWLALEWIEPGALSAEGTEALGIGLAAVHRMGADLHGALPPGSPDPILRIGSVALDLTPAQGVSSRAPDAVRASGPVAWADVYAERILMPLVAQAHGRGSLPDPDAAAIESVCKRIHELSGPAEPPSRLHGDLWGGNVLADTTGAPWLIDPAAYAGHREIDLAMLRLFGGAPARTFAAYEEAHPLAEGHAERVALWQILPLLVHAILFGGTYGEAAGRAASRYA